MAALVPIVMGAMGVSAAVTTMTTVAFSVLGINKKINEVATEVFGEDLVQVGSLLSLGFGAVDGLGDVGSAAALDGVDAAAGALSTSLSEGGNFTTLADWAEPMTSVGNVGAEGLTRGLGLGAAAEGAGAASPQSFFERFAPTEDGKGFDLLRMDEGTTPVGVESVLGDKASSGFELPSLEQSVSMQGQGAAGTSAAAPVKPMTRDELMQFEKAGSGAAAQIAANAARVAPGQRSFFDRLLFDEKGNINPRMAGSAMVGAGNAVSGYLARKQRQDEIDRQVAAANTGLVGWRRTQ